MRRLSFKPIKNNSKMEKTFRVIRETQVNTPESMLTITVGATVTIPCADFAPYSTVKSAATRLNQRAGFTEFNVSSPDNGATIVITRNAKDHKTESPRLRNTHKR